MWRLFPIRDTNSNSKIFGSASHKIVRRVQLTQHGRIRSLASRDTQSDWSDPTSKTLIMHSEWRVQVRSSFVENIQCVTSQIADHQPGSLFEEPFLNAFMERKRFSGHIIHYCTKDLVLSHIYGCLLLNCLCQEPLFFSIAYFKVGRSRVQISICSRCLAFFCYARFGLYNQSSAHL